MGKCWWKLLKHVKLRLLQKLKITLTLHVKSWTPEHTECDGNEDGLYLSVLKDDLI